MKEKKGSNAWFYFKKISPFLKDYKYSLIIISSLGLVISLISFLFPVLNAHLITNLTEFNVSKILYFILLILFFQSMVHILRYILSIMFEKTKGKIVYGIRQYICLNLFNLETKNFDSNATGLFQERVKADPEDITRIFQYFQFSFFDVLTNIGVFVYVFIISIPMGFYYLLTISILYFIQHKRIGRRAKNLKELKLISEKSSTLINEIIRGIKDIKVLNLKERFAKYTSVILYDHYQKGYKIQKTELNFWVVYRFTEHVFEVLVIILGIYLVLNYNLTVTNLLILYMYRHNIYMSIFNIADLKQYIADFSLACERIFEVIDSDKFSKEKFGSKNIGRIKGKIEFKNVKFGYDNNNIFKGLSFVINPNETVAIVGKSGEVKTSIFNLIARLYQPSGGKILIDDVNLNELSEESIRRNISIISQDPYIFNMTIKENLKLVKYNLTDEEIIEKCKIACIHDYIMTLPDKYDTLLGEGGVNLSGGQKQRLAITRALLKDTEIILFDEATSSLDNETQREIRQSIRNISKDFTIIIVAHRLSTVIDCDRILVLDKGKIVEEGTHKQLINDSKIYKELYRSNLE